MSDRRIVNVAAPVAGADAVNLTYFNANAILAANGSVAPTADKWLIRGSSGQAKAVWFEAGSGIPAGVGLIRAAKETTIIGARDAADAANISVLSIASDIIIIGGTTATAGIDAVVKSGALWRWMPNGAATVTLSGGNIVLASSSSAVPASREVTLFSNLGALESHGYNNISSVILPELASSVVAAQVGSRLVGVVSTTNATPTLALSIPIADITCETMLLYITAHRTNGATCNAAYARFVAAQREGAGSAVQFGATTVATYEEAGAAAYAITSAASGTNIDVTVTGDVGHNVDWMVAPVLYSRTSAS